VVERLLRGHREALQQIHLVTEPTFPLDARKPVCKRKRLWDWVIAHHAHTF